MLNVGVNIGRDFLQLLLSLSVFAYPAESAAMLQKVQRYFWAHVRLECMERVPRAGPRAVSKW